MSILYATGFDYFLNADDISESDMTAFGTPVLEESVVCSVHSRQSVKLTSNNRIALPKYTFYEETAYIAFWAYIITSPVINTYFCRMLQKDTIQMMLKFNFNDGSLSFVSGNYTTLGSSVPGIMTDGKWYYIEVKVTLKDSIATDDCIVRVDGNEVINVPATTDTAYSGGPYFDNFQLAANISQQMYFDDVIVYDTEGSTWNDFMGPRYISTLKVNGAGNSSQWTRSGGAANYEMVDEVEYDDDTSYVSTSTLNNKDLYTFEDLHASVNTIDAVCVNTVARRSTGINYRTIVPVTRISAADYDHDLANSAQDTYRAMQKIWTESPATATAWTPSEVNAAEFGIKVKT